MPSDARLRNIPLLNGLRSFIVALMSTVATSGREIMRFLVKYICLVAFLIAGCTDDVDPADPVAAYAAAKESYDDGYYEVALTKLG